MSLWPSTSTPHQGGPSPSLRFARPVSLSHQCLNLVCSSHISCPEFMPKTSGQTRTSDASCSLHVFLPDLLLWHFSLLVLLKNHSTGPASFPVTHPYQVELTCLQHRRDHAAQRSSIYSTVNSN